MNSQPVTPQKQISSAAPALLEPGFNAELPPVGEVSLPVPGEGLSEPMPGEQA